MARSLAPVAPTRSLSGRGGSARHVPAAFDALIAGAALSRAVADPALVAPADVAVLQRTIGNRAVADILRHVKSGDVQRRKEPGPGSEEGGMPPDFGQLTREQRLSGAHWKKIADDRWGGATPNIAELESGFGGDLQSFLDMLAANGITHSLAAGYRPKQRSYLFKYCLDVANGRIAAKDVPAFDDVDIIWDHGNDATSRKAAGELAKAFDLVGVAAHPSNHNSGTAVDMKLDFKGNPSNKLTYSLGARSVTRKIKVDDEARVGVSARGKSISDIGSRELSKAGADFGVKRALDNDIVHWSRSGR